MPKIEFDRKLSIGNVITIGVLLFSLATGWFSMVENLNASAREVESVSKRVDVLETNFAEFAKHFQAEKIDQTRILTQLQADIRYMRSAVDDLRERR